MVLLLTLNKAKIILVTLSKLKKTNSKTPVGETGCLYIAFFLAQPSLASSLTLLWTIARFLDPFYTFSPAHRRVIRNFTPPKPFECIGIQFFDSHTCDLRDVMLRQRSPFPPNPLPREVEDFPRGDRYFKHVPPPAYIIYLSPKRLY